MPHALSSHQAPSAVVYGLPPTEIIEAQVDRTTDPHHWLWDGNVNRYGEPVVRWATGKARPGSYVVARVLVVRQVGLEKYAKPIRIESRCGLVSCVNPDHWSVVTEHPRRITVVTDFDGHGGRVAQPASPAPETPLDPRIADLDDMGAERWRGSDPCPVCKAKPRQLCLTVAHERARAEAKHGKKLWDCYVCGAQQGLPCGAETHRSLGRPLDG